MKYKYIDAEKLKAIIKAQIKERKEWMGDIDRTDRQDQLWADLNGEDMSILQIIASLQQEQPADEDDGKFVKISVRKEFAEQFQKLGDEIQAVQSSFIGAMNRQEQQEVDLDDIIRVEFGTRAKVEGGKRYVKLDWDKFGILAYHFYALGQQSRIARKEE